MSNDTNNISNSATAKELNKVMDMTIQDKSLVITLLLWFFLGGLGAHRFYLGKVPSAIAMLGLTVVGYLTFFFIIGAVLLFGVFIWWIADLVMILRLSRTPSGMVAPNYQSHTLDGQDKTS